MSGDGLPKMRSVHLSVSTSSDGHRSQWRVGRCVSVVLAMPLSGTGDALSGPAGAPLSGLARGAPARPVEICQGSRPGRRPSADAQYIDAAAGPLVPLLPGRCRVRAAVRAWNIPRSQGAEPRPLWHGTWLLCSLGCSGAFTDMQQQLRDIPELSGFGSLKSSTGS